MGIFRKDTHEKYVEVLHLLCKTYLLSLGAPASAIKSPLDGRLIKFPAQMPSNASERIQMLKRIEEWLNMMMSEEY